MIRIGSDMAIALNSFAVLTRGPVASLTDFSGLILAGFSKKSVHSGLTNMQALADCLDEIAVAGYDVTAIQHSSEVLNLSKVAAVAPGAGQSYFTIVFYS